MRNFRITNTFRPGIGILAVPVLLGCMAVGVHAQDAAASADGGSSASNSSASQPASAKSDDIGEPPTPITTAEQSYPKLTGAWSGVSTGPSLSEKFNERLPAWLRFSGEFRERMEGYTGGSFKSSNTNDYLLQRIRLGMRIKPTNWLQFFIQAQDARVWGISPALPPYQNTTDIREAYVLLGNSEGNGFTLKAGRQEMSFGNNRFIGDSWWTNVSRSFDGVRAAYQVGRFRVDAFATSVVIVRTGVIDHALAGNDLYGLYGTAKDWIPHATIDAYEFWNIRPSFALQGLKSGHLNEWTTGFRLVGALPYHFDYRTEMAYQTGTLEKDLIRAWTGHWVLGYQFRNVRSKPRLFVEYDYASGSGNDKSGYDNTFDPLYPSTHDKLGLADQFGWRNIQDLRFGQEFRVTRKWSLGTSFHDFWLANAHDALYPTRGSFILQDPKGLSGTHVAEELDIQAIYTPTKQTQVDFGYGRVIPAQFLKTLTPGASYSYPYAQVEYVF